MLEAQSWGLSALELPGAEQNSDAILVHYLIASIRNLLTDDSGNEWHSRRAIAIEGDLNRRPHPRLRVMLAEGLAWQGKTDEALSSAREALALAEGQEHLNYRVLAMAQLVCFSVFFQQPPDSALVKECLGLAERIGSPVAIHIASYAAGVCAAADDPDEALAMFQRVDEMGERAGMRDSRVAVARAFSRLVDRSLSPSQALMGLVDSLEFFRRSGANFALRRMVRDFIPPFTALGRCETVAILDGAAKKYCIRPVLVAEAIGEARRALGTAGYRRAFQTGEAMSDTELERHVFAELQEFAEPVGRAEPPARK
jgi:hypothetical protein